MAGGRGGERFVESLRRWKLRLVVVTGCRGSGRWAAEVPADRRWRFAITSSASAS